MPWLPRFTESELTKAVAGAESWREVLDRLGYAYHGKNIETIRKWAGRWGVSIAHLSDHRGRSRRPRYTDQELRDAVSASLSWAETLRRLDLCPSGGNWRTLKRRVGELGISIEHFDPYAASRTGRRELAPLADVLVESSTYSRSCLKRRLYAEGLKDRRCELCSQGELWRGRKIGLILDHINGVRDDNRLENLRIVCPNCAAGLDTHCGRKNKTEVPPRACARCAKEFAPRYRAQRYCSAYCGSRWERARAGRSFSRKVERPPYEQLLEEVRASGYLAVGRRYGVSDNAVRKWLRAYERERAAETGREIRPIPTRTWPNRKRAA